MPIKEWAGVWLRAVAVVNRFAPNRDEAQRIIWYFGVSTYLNIPLVFHAPQWSALPQFRREQTVPAQVTLCLLLKHMSPGLRCLGDTAFLLFRPVADRYDRLLSIPASQVLGTGEVASSCLFIHRHARLSSQAIQVVS
jgi:hypothetical protein